MKSDYLDPRWQKFRLNRLENAQWKCQGCSDNGSTLHIHHTYYVAGRKPWQYPLGATLVLCDGCHEHIHKIQKDFDTDGEFEWEQSVVKYFEDWSPIEL